MNLLFSTVLVALLISTNLFAKEELAVIQTVSKSRKSFVISKGIKDGITKGHEMIFSNNNVSIVCRATEVNRTYSLWTPVDKLITVPFNQEDIVSANTNVEGNVALELRGELGADYDGYRGFGKGFGATSFFNETYKKFRTQNNFSLKSSYNRGLSQSSSSVDEEKNSIRTGYNFAIEYNYRLRPQFEMSAGARLDYEVYHIKDPELDIPTQRIMATLALTYHFVNFSINENNLYLTIATGLGKSQTTVNGEDSSGQVSLMPEVRFGLLMPLSKTIAMVFESSVESISATEKFADDSEQKTNLLNMRLTMGLRF